MPPRDYQTLEEHARKAKELYRRVISPEMETANLDRLVALDTESGDFEIGDNLIDIVHRLRARRPDAFPFSFRIGGWGRAADRLGSPRREFRPGPTAPRPDQESDTQQDSPKAILDRGEEIYGRLIQPVLESKNLGRLVAIDVDSERFEIGDDLLEISRRLREGRLDARIAAFRVENGGGPIDRLGYHPSGGA